MDMNLEYKRAIEIGQRNQEIERLVQNFCSHVQVEQFAGGGIGLVEHMTGLPIGMRIVRCQFAKNPSNASMNLESLALGFYEANCLSCPNRKGVRFPNISMLYAEQEAKSKEEEKLRDDAIRAAQEAQRIRKENRAIHRNPQDSMRQEIINLIDDADILASDEIANKLALIAENAPKRFDAQIIDMLFELIDVGMTLRTDVGFKALRRVASADSRLMPAALKALARGDSLVEAGSIVETHLSSNDCRGIRDAVWALVSLASPSRMSFLGDGETTTLRPGPLIRAYQICREPVIEALKDFLKRDEKDIRIATCRSIERLLAVDGELAAEVIDPLLNSIGLPDDHYEDGPAASHAMNALAVAMFKEPAKVDAAIQSFLKRATKDVAKEAFGAYDSVIRRKLRTDNNVPKEAVDLAVKRAIEILLDPNNDLLGEAIEVLDLATKCAPKSFFGKEELLIGAAIFIETELRKPKQSVLIDPNWNPLKGLEAGHRNIILNSALRSLGDAMKALAANNPTKLLVEISKTFDAVKDNDDATRIRGILVNGLLGIGLHAEFMGRVLPFIYTAMHDSSSSVRAVAAEACGDLFDQYGPDLPILLHETLILLLTDSYVSVHKAALRAIRYKDFPESLRGRLLSVLILLCKVYINDDDDGFLSECLFETSRRAKQSGADDNGLASFILKSVLKMKSSEAIQTIAHFNLDAIYKNPLFTDLMARLLKDTAAFGHREDEMIQLVSALHEQSLSELAQDVADASVRAYKSHQGMLALEFIELLAAAGEFEAALKAIGELLLVLPDTIEKRAARKEMDLRRVAIEFEQACRSGDLERILRLSSTWRTLERGNDEIEPE